MKVSSPSLLEALSPTTMKLNQTEKSVSPQYASELKRLDRINLIDFIHGDSRLPERYVFDPDLFPDYSRATQRRLVSLIQQVCEHQSSPVSVHQWATEEHDDRVVRRIRFRCAFFRKKKRAAGVPTCGFQFQVCYQQKYGWCLLNGKGQSRHCGHDSSNTKTVTPKAVKSSNTTPKSRKKASPKGTKKEKLAQKEKPALKEVPTPVSKRCGSPCCSMVSLSPSHEFPDENQTCNVSTAQAKTAAWKDLEQTSDCKVPPMYTDFALDPAMEDIMDWDLLDETADAMPTSTPASSGGLLQKTIHLTQTPFPELVDMEDKCAGLMEALRAYASAHNFCVSVEDYATVDRPGEKTIRVVYHCLGSGSGCCYQVALLWVVGLTKWQIYCQPDGIFVHSCGRREGQTTCSAMAATPLYQALDHLADFLDGDVVCPDENGGGDNDSSDDSNMLKLLAWKKEEKPPVSDNVRKETRKAVAKVAGVDATASAA